MDLSFKNVYWEITNRCNLFCKHCYNSSNEKNYTFLDMRLAKKVINELHEFKTKSIALSGGEPLLHPEIKEICTYACKQGFSVTIVTNGTLLTPETLSWIKKENIKLQISFESTDPRCNDMIRGQGTFKKVMGILNMLKEREYLYNVELHPTLQKMNFSTVEETILFAKRIGCGGVGFSIWTPIGRSQANYEKMVLSDDENAKLIKLINRCVETFSSENFYISDYNYVLECNLLNSEEISPYFNSMGYAFLCSGFYREEDSLGNIFTENLSQIYTQQRKMKILNKVVEELYDCKSCTLKRICTGGCLTLKFPHKRGDGFCELRKRQVLSHLKYSETSI